jgi:hypothetical protein
MGNEFMGGPSSSSGNQVLTQINEVETELEKLIKVYKTPIITKDAQKNCIYRVVLKIISGPEALKAHIFVKIIIDQQYPHNGSIQFELKYDNFVNIKVHEAEELIDRLNRRV